jgi:hypothetical protein
MTQPVAEAVDIVKFSAAERGRCITVKLAVRDLDSLPSGRYSLLGPDLHRLDRTSFCLAHSFDHLVGER